MRCANVFVRNKQFYNLFHNYRQPWIKLQRFSFSSITRRKFVDLSKIPRHPFLLPLFLSVPSCFLSFFFFFSFFFLSDLPFSMGELLIETSDLLHLECRRVFGTISCSNLSLANRVSSTASALENSNFGDACTF